MILIPKDPHVLQVTQGRSFILFEDLLDGHLYRGECRNADAARWDAVKQRFTYMRFKFHPPRFPEDIEHCQSDTRYDVFIPFEDLGECTLEELKEK